PTPSSAASSITPTASPSRETACERSPPNVPILTPPRKPESTHHAGNHTPAAFVGTGGRLRSERVAAFNRNPWPQSSESADIVTMDNEPFRSLAGRHALDALKALAALAVDPAAPAKDREHARRMVELRL